MTVIIWDSSTLPGYDFSTSYKDDAVFIPHHTAEGVILESNEKCDKIAYDLKESDFDFSDWVDLSELGTRGLSQKQSYKYSVKHQEEWISLIAKTNSALIEKPETDEIDEIDIIAEENDEIQYIEEGWYSNYNSSPDVIFSIAIPNYYKSKWQYGSAYGKLGWTGPYEAYASISDELKNNSAAISAFRNKFGSDLLPDLLFEQADDGGINVIMSSGEDNLYWVEHLEKVSESVYNESVTAAAESAASEGLEDAGDGSGNETARTPSSVIGTYSAGAYQDIGMTVEIEFTSENGGTFWYGDSHGTFKKQSGNTYVFTTAGYSDGSSADGGSMNVSLVFDGNGVLTYTELNDYGWSCKLKKTK